MLFWEEGRMLGIELCLIFWTCLCRQSLVPLALEVPAAGGHDFLPRGLATLERH